MNEKNLIPREEPMFLLDGQVTSTALILPDDITVESLIRMGHTFVRMEDSKQWWIGDWWNRLDRKYGESQKICDDVGLNITTTKACGNVANRFEIGRRRPDLSFNHHREVCSVNLEDKDREKLIQDNFLKRAEQEKWSVHTLRKNVQDFLDEEKWTDEEKARRLIVLEGGSILINMKQGADDNIRTWAEMNGVLERIDRSSDWGNPFIMDQEGRKFDGDRDEVCDKYAVYLDLKTSLLNRLDELRGKVLGCWCRPARCHGDELLKRLQ